MITKFSYTARADDIYEFYNFWLKQRRTGTLMYVLGLFWLVPAAYTAISSGEYWLLLISAAAIFAIIGAALFSIKSKTKKDISKMLKFDKNYLCETSVTVYENAIEMQTNAPAGEVQITEIYPFEMLANVYETQRHFYLIFLNSEVKVIPKAGIPQESAEKLSKKISNNPAYKFISQESR
ncbi:MAG: YcxB family protein [Clostridiales bacterium]|nr:YcxB family protein [Clostridiales bacterium]